MYICGSVYVSTIKKCTLSLPLLLHIGDLKFSFISIIIFKILIYSY
jgi:hypothetical protein